MPRYKKGSHQELWKVEYKNFILRIYILGPCKYYLLLRVDLTPFSFLLWSGIRNVKFYHDVINSFVNQFPVN